MRARPAARAGGFDRHMADQPLWKRVLILGICLIGIIVALPNAF